LPDLNVTATPMTLRPVRLPPGADLRASIERIAAALPHQSGFVVSGIGSLTCEVRTTAELLVAELPGFKLSREFDAGTGFKELVIHPAQAAITRKGNDHV